MKKKVSLWLLLSMTFVVTLVFSISIFYLFIIKNVSTQVEKHEKVQLLANGRQLAKEELVINQLVKNKPSNKLQTYTDQFSDIYQLDFVVVMDMSSIRLTHPDVKNVGKHFKGDDEQPALRGKEHVSISEGTLGTSLRAFIPVFKGQTQIGVVAIGIKMTSLSAVIHQSKSQYYLSLLIGFIISLVVALSLACYLKKILLNLEPQEIASLLEERNAMLEETKDAVIVIDMAQTVLLANHQAVLLYRYTTGCEDLVGDDINGVIVNFSDIDLNKKTEQVYHQNGQDYFVSVAPIMIRKEQTGYILFLRNATETLFASYQLANTTAYASSLQAQSHEFMNKLHVIYGLADLQEYGELNNYLKKLLTPEKEFSRYLSLLVKDPLIASFLMGERQKFSEIKTTLKIEFLSAIPATNQQTTNQFIMLVRLLHYAFLQKKIADEMTLTVSWYEDQLTLTYLLSQKVINGMKEHLNSFYFQELLAESDSHLILATDSLKLKFKYQREEF